MKLKLALAALALSSMNLASAGIINGNFETGSLSPWTSSGSVALTDKVTPNFYHGAGSTGQDGAYAVVFNAGASSANGALWQDFATVASHTYRLTFDFGATSGGSQTIQASLLNGATQLATVNAADTTPSAQLSSFILDFIATGALTRLRFDDLAANFNSTAEAGVLDNIAIVDTTSATSVPEPASLALLGMGLFGLGALRRKRAA